MRKLTDKQLKIGKRYLEQIPNDNQLEEINISGSLIRKKGFSTIWKQFIKKVVENGTNKKLAKIVTVKG